MPRVTITVPDRNPQPYRFQLDREVVCLGRGSENDIVIDSGSVSTSHAEMRRVTGGYQLQDMGSTNGLKSDGVRYETVPLYHGSSVSLGDVTFDFSLTDEEQEMLAREIPSSATSAAPPPVSTQPMGKSSKAKSPPKRQVIHVDDGGGGGSSGALLLVLFSLSAFGTGLAVRHHKETGGSLIDGVKAKFFAGPAPAAPRTPATDAVPPPAAAQAPAPRQAPAPPPPAAPPIPAAPAGGDLPPPQ